VTGGEASPHSLTAVYCSSSIIGLTQELVLKALRDHAKSINLIQSRLNALLLSATEVGDGSHLPEKENIGPNQCSWPKTALKMGVKCGKIRRKGKVDSTLTAQHIGEPNCKRASEYDPYEWESSLANGQSLMHN